MERGAGNQAEEADDDAEISYGVETDFNSAYIWHGIVLSNAPVLQPSAWIAKSGFMFAASDNLPVAGQSQTLHVRSTDAVLSYVREWKKLRVEPFIEGYLNRSPNGAAGQDPRTAEASVKLSYPIGPLRACVTNTFDVAAWRGAYFGEACLEYQRPLARKTVLNIAARSGWASAKFNDVYAGVDKAAFNFVGIDGSLTFRPNSYLYLKPHFEFTNTVDAQLRQSMPWPTMLSGGLAVGVEF
jgi:hypothetical protein